MRKLTKSDLEPSNFLIEDNETETKPVNDEDFTISSPFSFDSLFEKHDFQS